jgi:hypothetical protein
MIEYLAAFFLAISAVLSGVVIHQHETLVSKERQKKIK